MYKRVWLVTVDHRGFTMKVLVDTTEEKLTEYLKTELPSYRNYRGATEEDIESARKLGMSIYLY